MKRAGIEGRWLSGGPPSGRRFMSGIVPALAEHPDRPEHGYVVFDRSGDQLREGSGAATPDVLRFRRLPSAPAPFFNSVEIQMALPSDVEAVLYQSFTPPASRAGRVVVIHDLIYLTRPDLFTRLERAYFRTLPALLPRAEVVAAVSEHVRTAILEQLPRRDPATVKVIPNGVDRRFFISPEGKAAAGDAACRAYGLDRPFALAVGRRNPRKNLARLVRALSAAGIGDMDLVLAGPTDGPRDRDLDAAIAAAPAGRIRELGTVGDDLLPGLYAAAECVCYISLEEGFGVPPLEAMAAGTPVLGSSIPPLQEVLGDAALLVDPLDEEAIRDGLRRVTLDAGIRKKLVERGHERAAGYSWSRSAGAALDALRLAAALKGRS